MRVLALACLLTGLLTSTFFLLGHHPPAGEGFARAALGRVNTPARATPPLVSITATTARHRFESWWSLHSALLHVARLPPLAFNWSVDLRLQSLSLVGPNHGTEDRCVPAATTATRSCVDGSMRG